MKERLIKTMNCECLQSIIKNDEEKHTNEYTRLGKIFKRISSKADIYFECNTHYKETITDITFNRIEKNISSESKCGIPFLYCPICGQKSKTIVPKDSFYHKFQINK